jgi:hypothetical protein
MSLKKSYVVFRCPNCGFYSLASRGQKTRLCVRCDKSLKIDRLEPRSVEGFEEARTLVNELNLKVGQTISPISHDSIKLPSAESSLKNTVAGRDRRKGLLRTFQEDILTKYSNRDVELAELFRECEKFDVPREYAEKLIGKLVRSGEAYRPREGWIRFL